MKQTRIHSAIEVITNQVLGFAIALATWYVLIIPFFDVHTDFVESVGVTLIFTVVSIIRSYVVRRFFTRATAR